MTTYYIREFSINWHSIRLLSQNPIENRILTILLVETILLGTLSAAIHQHLLISRQSGAIIVGLIPSWASNHHSWPEIMESVSKYRYETGHVVGCQSVRFDHWLMGSPRNPVLAEWLKLSSWLMSRSRLPNLFYILARSNRHA